MESVICVKTVLRSDPSNLFISLQKNNPKGVDIIILSTKYSTVAYVNSEVE